MTERPASLIDMLKNIQSSFENELPLSDEFYSDDFLQRHFGGSNVIWQEPTDDNGRKLAFITGFGSMVSPIVIGQNTFSGIDLSVKRSIRADDTREATLNLSLIGSEKDLSFERVESIFGKNWNSLPYFPLPSGKILKPTRFEHGNERINYSKNTKTSQLNIIMEFNENATMHTAYFKLERK